MCLKPGNSIKQYLIYLKLRLKLNTGYSSDNQILLSNFKQTALGVVTKQVSELQYRIAYLEGLNNRRASAKAEKILLFTK